MKFLSKLGQIILKGVEIWYGFAPAISAAAPGTSGTIQTISHDLTQIANIIAQVEVMGQALQLAGPQKLIAAAPSVEQIILQSTLLVNHKIANADLFKQGATKIADGMADVLNSFHDQIETVNKA